MWIPFLSEIKQCIVSEVLPYSNVLRNGDSEHLRLPIISTEILKHDAFDSEDQSYYVPDISKESSFKVIRRKNHRRKKRIDIGSQHRRKLRRKLFRVS